MPAVDWMLFVPKALCVENLMWQSGSVGGGMDHNEERPRGRLLGQLEGCLRRDYGKTRSGGTDVIPAPERTVNL
jgi:hypothetical protein